MPHWLHRVFVGVPFVPQLLSSSNIHSNVQSCNILYIIPTTHLIPETEYAKVNLPLSLVSLAGDETRSTL